MFVGHCSVSVLLELNVHRRFKFTLQFAVWIISTIAHTKNLPQAEVYALMHRHNYILHVWIGMEKRSANLTAADRQVIVELVEQHARVIENKKTDMITNKEKDATWQLVAAQFNATRPEHRTAQQLKQVIFLIQSCFRSAKFIIHLIHSLFRPTLLEYLFLVSTFKQDAMLSQRWMAS